MDWNSGLSAIYELREVDPISWMDLGSLDFTAGTITRTDSNLIESASLKMTESVREGWVRIYLKARQAGTGTRVPVFTGLAMTPQRVLNGYMEDNTIKCYSVLKPAEDTLTPRGYYVPAGAPGAQLVAQLLSVGAAPVTFDDYGPELMEPIVTEDSDTNLSVAWKILDAIGWRILLSGDGRIRVCPAATEPVVGTQFRGGMSTSMNALMNSLAACLSSGTPAAAGYWLPTPLSRAFFSASIP